MLRRTRDADFVIERRGRGDGNPVPLSLASLDDPEERAPLAVTPEPRLEALVRDHHPFAWRVLRRLGLSDADADDAVQRVFLIVAKRLADIAPGSERAFLYRTAAHVASKVHRARRRRPESPEADCGEQADRAPLADDLIDQRRARDLLDVILGELPEDLRAVLILFEIEGLTTTEVAEAIGAPVGTVASRLRRARVQLEACVTRHLARARFKGALP